MGIKLTNNAETLLAVDIIATDTSIVVEDASSFPTLGAGEYFYCTLESLGGTYEIVKVTGISGDVLGVTRAQENTSAHSFSSGARVELRITVQNLTDAASAAASALISDTAYDATTWNGVTTIAPSKNTVRDALVAGATSTAMLPVTQAATVDDALNAAGFSSFSRTLRGATSALATVNLLANPANIFYPTARTDDAVQVAINAAVSAGGGVVMCEAADYVFDTGVTLYSNVTIMGVPSRTRFVGSGTANIYLMQYVGNAQTIADLAVNAAADARQITLTSGSNVSTGSFLRIIHVEPVTGVSHQWTTQVTDKAGAVLTLADPLPLAIATADVHDIQTVFPLTNFAMHNITLSKGTNSHATTSGIQVQIMADSEIINCQADGFAGGTGFYILDAYRCLLEDITTSNTGSGGVAAQEFVGFTNSRFSNLQSDADANFGIVIFCGAYNVGNNISATACTGRGLKIQSDLYSVYTNIKVNNNGLTGIYVPVRSIGTQIVNVEASKNGWSTPNDGVAISNSSEVRIRGVRASGNSNFDIVIDGSCVNCSMTDVTATNISVLGTGTFVTAPNKLHVTATDKVLGRVSSGAGAVEEITFTDQAQQLCDDTSFAAMRTTLQLGTAAEATIGTSGDTVPKNNTANTFSQALSLNVPGSATILSLGNAATTGVIGGDGAYLYLTSGGSWGIDFRPNSTSRMALGSAGGLTIGSPTGGNKGHGTLNATAVYDDNTLLTCYVFDAALDGDIDFAKWDALTPNREHGPVMEAETVEIPAVFETQTIDGKAVEVEVEPARREIIEREIEPARTEERIHEPMRKFAARLGTDTDPLDLDAYINHWRTKRHLTSMPNERKFDPEAGMATGEWVQRLIETVEIQAVHISQLHDRLKAVETQLSTAAVK